MNNTIVANSIYIIQLYINDNNKDNKQYVIYIIITRLMFSNKKNKMVKYKNSKIYLSNDITYIKVYLLLNFLL